MELIGSMRATSLIASAHIIESSMGLWVKHWKNHLYV